MSCTPHVHTLCVCACVHVVCSTPPPPASCLQKTRHCYYAPAKTTLQEPRTLSAAVSFYCGRLHSKEAAHSALGDAWATVRVLVEQVGDGCADRPGSEGNRGDGQGTQGVVGHARTISWCCQTHKGRVQDVSIPASLFHPPVWSATSIALLPCLNYTALIQHSFTVLYFRCGGTASFPAVPTSWLSCVHGRAESRTSLLTASSSGGAASLLWHLGSTVVSGGL